MNADANNNTIAMAKNLTMVGICNQYKNTFYSHLNGHSAQNSKPRLGHANSKRYDEYMTNYT